MKYVGIVIICIVVGLVLIYLLAWLFKPIWNGLFPEPKIPTHHAFNKEVLEKRVEEIKKYPIIPSDAYKKIRAEREVHSKIKWVAPSPIEHVCRICRCSALPCYIEKGKLCSWYSKFGKKSLCNNPKCASYRNRIFQHFLQNPAPDYTSRWLVEFFGVLRLSKYPAIQKKAIPEKSVLKNLLYLTREKKLVRHILPGTKIYSYRLNRD